MGRQPSSSFAGEFPRYEAPVSPPWILGVVLLWTTLAAALAMAWGTLLARLTGDGVAAWATGYVIGGLIASSIALWLVVRRMARLHRRHNEILHQWQEVQQMFLDNMPQGVFWKDRQGVYLGCNRLFAAIAGRKGPEAVVGLTDHDLPWPPEQTAFFRKIDEEVVRADEPQLNVVEPLTDAEGHPHWHQVNKVPLHDLSGKVVGILGTYQDITDYKLLEERMYQAEKLRSIGQLAGGVAHDFNNMLGGILGAAELLDLTLPDVGREVRQNIDIIRDTARRAGELTQQLLAFSRKAKKNAVPTDMNTVVRQTAGILSHTLGPSIELELDLSDVPVVVKGDAAQLQNAVLNLAVNARDAMPSGGCLRLATSRVVVDEALCQQQGLALKTGPHVRITVTDTGVGMSQEVRDRIFEPFFTTKGVGKGTGLGLAAVYGTVKDHLGACSVQSEIGKGTVFDVYLPQSSEAVAAGPADEAAAAEHGHGRVLLVDDEEIIRATAGSMLEQLGYEVTVAENGRQAADVFARSMEASRPFDLVILDLIMPVMKGSEAFGEIRRADPQAKVLLASGFSVGSDVEELLAAGALGFIQKPYRFSTLATAVAEAIQGRPVLIGLEAGIR
ncbi:MAG: response regulator [Planctomycetes bacterium]|nr:response regulator [Planctomycetota bacterium]